MTIFKSIQKYASVQHGIVARFQLLDEGVSSNSIKSTLRAGALVAVDNGVYKTIGSQKTWEQRAAVATLSCGRNGYLSHESVLMLFDLLPKDRDRISKRRTDKERNQLIHVTTPRPIKSIKNIYFHRSKRLSTHEKSLAFNGIKHVPIERAIIDCAQQLSDYELDFTIDKALSLELITTRRMISTMGKLKTAPGREKNRTRKLLEPYLSKNNNSDSQLEKRVERIVSQMTSRELIRQHAVRIRGRDYRIDLSIPSSKIAIEVDGFAFHRSRTKFDDDRRRQNDLISAGWKLARVTAAFNDEEIRQAVIPLLAT